MPSCKSAAIKLNALIHILQSRWVDQAWISVDGTTVEKLVTNNKVGW